MSTSQEEKEWFNDEENVLYSFPAFDTFDRDYSDRDEKMPPLVLELIPLPLLSENFEQMPVGAKGWYASAILSAMMMLSYGSITCDDGLDENDCVSHLDNHSLSKATKGTDLLRSDLKQACEGANHTKNNNVFLELGSGTIGLSGMTMAWIIAQHERNARKSQDPSESRNKVILTDYDYDCLAQLERNAVGVRKTFAEYFSAIRFTDDGLPDTDTNSNGEVPDIDVVHLDWNEYDQDQSPLLSENTSMDDQNSISFVCGAALVYMEDTAACVDQVAKILRLHPKSVVWVVQWPRDGWFSVFQQELLSPRFRSEGLNIDVRKFGPSSSPDMFSTEVQQLAQKLMPGNMHQEVQMNIKDLRAVRITNTVS